MYVLIIYVRTLILYIYILPGTARNGYAAVSDRFPKAER